MTKPKTTIHLRGDPGDTGPALSWFIAWCCEDKTSAAAYFVSCAAGDEHISFRIGTFRLIFVNKLQDDLEWSSRNQVCPVCEAGVLSHYIATHPVFL